MLGGGLNIRTGGGETFGGVGLRNVPLILSWSLVMRRSRSAWLFVNGTAVLVSIRKMSG